MQDDQAQAPLESIPSVAGENLKRYYQFVGGSPKAWRNVALELKYAADAVARQWHLDRDGAADRVTVGAVPPPMLGQSYMLLAAFAVENLAKALLIQQDAELFPLTDPEEGGIKTHRIVQLLEKISGTWTGEERTLARRLTEFAVWGGRYPVPLAPTSLTGWKGYTDRVRRPDGVREEISGGMHMPGAVYWHDSTDVDRLFNKLLRLLEAT
jgi:hypothetical protein